MEGVYAEIILGMRIPSSKALGQEGTCLAYLRNRGEGTGREGQGEGEGVGKGGEEDSSEI